ncbi:MAG: GNAT family protein [Bacteroidota bacterium]
MSILRRSEWTKAFYHSEFILMDHPNIYPIQYIKPLTLKNGEVIQLRPIHPVDGQQAFEFRAKLSSKSIHDRFLGYVPNITPPIVDYLTRIDYSKDMAIIAETVNHNEKKVIAVARIAAENTRVSDFAIIIADEWHGKGLGTALTGFLIQIAKDLNYEKIYANYFSDNVGMEMIFKKFGFTIRKDDALTKYAELKF